MLSMSPSFVQDDMEMGACSIKVSDNSAWFMGSWQLSGVYSAFGVGIGRRTI